jgi:tetratricopeptide (TPR) repeat protein
MTDPLRADRPPASADVPERDRDAHVEELLLTGLDNYFDGQHELAINVWTRVLFLDRGHARARAYIERARSALSERQREGDELLHTGAAAFERGDVETARHLLSSAVERGGATEEALALLERLDRLETAGMPGSLDVGRPLGTASSHTRGGPAPAQANPRRARIAWLAAGVVGGLLAAAVLGFYLLARSGDLLGLDNASVPVASGVPQEALLVPAASEVWLSRARALYAKGHLHEALTALAPVRPGDALRPEADELRADIQQQLLAAGRASAPAPVQEQQVPSPRR